MQLALSTQFMTLEETFADWGPSYDAMIADLEREALDDSERDQDLQCDPEFKAIARRPSFEDGGDDGGR